MTIEEIVEREVATVARGRRYLFEENVKDACLAVASAILNATEEERAEWVKQLSR